MKKNRLNILIFFLFMTNLALFGQEKIIKSITTEAFFINGNHDNLDSVYFRGDTAIMLISIERFNEQGKRVSHVSYYPNGEKKSEERAEYDTKGRLTKFINIDYYGKGDQVEWLYAYDQNDSLKKVEIISDSVVFETIAYDRSPEGKLLTMWTIYEGIRTNEQRFEYYPDGKLFKILKFENSLQYAYNERKYNVQGQLIEEIRYGEDLGWYCEDTCHNFYYYDSNGNMVLAKYGWENDSNYTEHIMTYDENQEVIEVRRIGKGCIRCTLEIDKYDQHGNRESHEYIREDEGYHKGWYYQYEYDAFGNWLIKIESHANSIIQANKRTIEYY